MNKDTWLSCSYMCLYIDDTIGLKGGVVELGSLTLCNLGKPYNLAGLEPVG